MILIVGLGNPGRKFQKTRHNIGFRVISQFLKKNNFPKFRFFKKNGALVSKGSLNKKRVVLAQPQTFMNNSGKSVELLTRTYSLDHKNLIVIHDDIDLVLGEIKISKGKGAAGHKGVQSIINELETKDFVRFRLGIKPKFYILTPKSLNKFVLRKFTKKEERVVKKVIKKTVEAIELTLKENVEKAMGEFNKSPQVK